MAGSSRDNSIDAEPHRRKQTFTPDSSEERAERQLARERAGVDPAEERAAHSVFDELAMLPNRPPALIDRDWSCGNCGYNLRGLLTGHPCPECGKIERYEPPREGEVTYARWLAEHESRTSPVRSWLIAGVVPLASIPFAFGCGFVTVEYAGVVNFAAIGPVIAEVMRVAVASVVIQRRTFWIRRAGQIHLMTLGTAVVFAVAQNIIYLLVFFKSSPLDLIAYRWFVGVLLHIMCALIATRGLANVWGQAVSEKRSVDVTRAYPYVVAAAAFHAVFNTCVFVRGHLGYGF